MSSALPLVPVTSGLFFFSVFRATSICNCVLVNGDITPHTELGFGPSLCTEKQRTLHIQQLQHQLRVSPYQYVFLVFSVGHVQL